MPDRPLALTTAYLDAHRHRFVLLRGEGSAAAAASALGAAAASTAGAGGGGGLLTAQEYLLQAGLARLQSRFLPGLSPSARFECGLVCILFLGGHVTPDPNGLLLERHFRPIF